MYVCCLIPCQVFWCCSVLSILSHQMISLLKTRSFITLTLKAFTNTVAIKQACSLICCHTYSTVLFPPFSGHHRDKIMVLVAALTLHANARYFQGLSIMVKHMWCHITTKTPTTHKNNKCNCHFATVFVLNRAILNYKPRKDFKEVQLQKLDHKKTLCNHFDKWFWVFDTKIDKFTEFFQYLCILGKTRVSKVTPSSLGMIHSMTAELTEKITYSLLWWPVKVQLSFNK